MTERLLPRTRPRLVHTFALPQEWANRPFTHIELAGGRLIANTTELGAHHATPVRVPIAVFDVAERRELFRVRLDSAVERCSSAVAIGDAIVTTVQDAHGVWLFRMDGELPSGELLRGPGEYENDGFGGAVRPAPGGCFVSWSFEPADGKRRSGETQRRDAAGRILWSTSGWARLAQSEAVIVQDDERPYFGMRGIDPESGRELWCKTIAEPFFYGVTGGHVVTGPPVLRGPIRGLDPSTGEVVWTAELGGIAQQIRAWPHIALAISETDSHRLRLHRLAPGGDEIASGFLDGIPGELRAIPYAADDASLAWLAQSPDPKELVCEALAEPGAILWRLPVPGFSIAFAPGLIAVQRGNQVELYAE